MQCWRYCRGQEATVKKKGFGKRASSVCIKQWKNWPAKEQMSGRRLKDICFFGYVPHFRFPSLILLILFGLDLLSMFYISIFYLTSLTFFPLIEVNKWHLLLSVIKSIYKLASLLQCFSLLKYRRHSKRKITQNRSWHDEEQKKLSS